MVLKDIWGLESRDVEKISRWMADALIAAALAEVREARAGKARSFRYNFGVRGALQRDARSRRRRQARTTFKTALVNRGPAHGDEPDKPLPVPGLLRRQRTDHERCTKPETFTDYHVADIVARPLGPPRDRHRRDRDARPHGHPRGVRRAAAPQGRAHHRLAPHDHPDGRPDRDAQGARRRGPLGLVQHLLDPGPRRRRHRRGRHPRLRLQGRVARRVLGLHPQDLRVGRRRRTRT